jgi:hypothetical protein
MTMCKQLEFCCPLCHEQLESALLTRAAFIFIALSSFAFEFSDKFDFTSPVFLKKVPDPNDVHPQAHVTDPDDEPLFKDRITIVRDKLHETHRTSVFKLHETHRTSVFKKRKESDCSRR